MARMMLLHKTCHVRPTWLTCQAPRSRAKIALSATKITSAMECLARFRLACGQVGELRLGGGAGGPVVPRVVPPRAQGRAAMEPMVSPFLLALLWSLGVDSISLAVSAVSTFRY